MLGIERSAGARYSGGCRFVMSDLSHGLRLPLPICPGCSAGYGRTTVLACVVCSALKRFGGALRGRL